MVTTISAPSDPLRSRRIVDLVRISATRALKVRYRGTVLGILWSFANPVLMTVIYSAIFGTAFSKYYDGSVARYVVSAFVGLVAVTFFLASTNESLQAIVSGGSLLNKIALPPLVFPLSIVAANVFQQAVTTFPIVFVLSIVLTHDPVRVLLVPVVLAAIVMLTAGVSIALSVLFVFFRDLPHVWNIFGFILWLTSPLFYPVALVPENLRFWYALNPVGQAIAALRQVAIVRGPLDLHPIVATLVAGALALAAGAWLYRVTRREFMDLI
ncbi:MAG TPA: ABC transporter permease [Xanthomonadales bacterium]|nr:ABC transporter permease [Xanthomonadales bacterium]